MDFLRARLISSRSGFGILTQRFLVGKFLVRKLPVCVKHRGVRFHRIRDVKQCYGQTANEDPIKSELESRMILNVEGGLSSCTVQFLTAVFSEFWLKGSWFAGSWYAVPPYHFSSIPISQLRRNRRIISRTRLV